MPSMTATQNSPGPTAALAAQPFVIGTAGHVDHGKSTLVKALTGIDPDRLAEEKARAMTIDLGFAWLTLPNGQPVSIVDVPGHERFIKNMLAGVGGIDAALLVIAADEGPMPQTDEHLAILDLLGVERGVVVLTKQDTVDADWLDLVREEVRERLAGTTLAQAPIVSVSALTGEGLPALIVEIASVLAAAPPGFRSIASSPSPASAPSSPAPWAVGRSPSATSCASIRASGWPGCAAYRATRRRSAGCCRAVEQRSTSPGSRRRRSTAAMSSPRAG
jgi:small GTP-binding protein